MTPPGGTPRTTPPPPLVGLGLRMPMGPNGNPHSHVRFAYGFPWRNVQIRVQTHPCGPPAPEGLPSSSTSKFDSFLSQEIDKTILRDL